MAVILSIPAFLGCSSDSQPTATNGASTGASSSTTGGGTSMAGAGGSTSGAGGQTSGGASVGTGGSSSGAGAPGSGGLSSSAGGAAAGDGSAPPSYDQVKAWIDAYKTAHPGNGGKDWDINAKTPAEVAADPDAARLLALCGPGQRPVIPELAWEYGGSDHQWINPAASPLVICVYVAASPSTAHFQYDSTADHITADAYVLYPNQNPCKDRTGADQVLGCVGDPTNLEILVDTISYHDGADVGLTLANSSTDVMLILPDGSKVLLYQSV